MATINSLAAETLGACFVSVVHVKGMDQLLRHGEPPDYKSLKSILLVCRTWNNVAIGEKTLWTYLSSSYTQHWNELLVKRSLPRPLAVNLTMLADGDLRPQFDTLLDTIASEMNRVVYFNIDTSDHAFLRRVLFRTDAPMLETLAISDFPTTSAEFSSRLFGGCTPRLRFVSIHDTNFRWRSSVLSNLKILSLSYVPQHCWPTFTELIQMLERSPQLVKLEMIDSGPRLSSTIDLSEKRVQLLSLKECLIEDRLPGRSQSVSWVVFNHVHAPSLSKLAIAQPCFNDEFDISNLLPDNFPAMLNDTGVIQEVRLVFPIRDILEVKFGGKSEEKDLFTLKYTETRSIRNPRRALKGLLFSCAREWDFRKATRLHVSFQTKSRDDADVTSLPADLLNMLPRLKRLKLSGRNCPPVMGRGYSSMFLRALHGARDQGSEPHLVEVKLEHIDVDASLVKQVDEHNSALRKFRAE